MIDHVTEVPEEKDRVNDLDDPTEDEVVHDHVIDVEKDPILEIEVTLEDMIEDEVDHHEEDDVLDHHHHNIEEVADAVDLAVAVEADVVAGVIGADETKVEITGVVMILMVLTVNQNLVVVTMICLLMGFLLLHHPLIVEAVMATVVVGGQTMTEVILDVNQVGTATTVENADRPTKVKNGQGSGDGFQTDLK